jgi:VLRF1 release factor-like protein
VSNEAAGGTRWIEVGPDRLAGWIESFAERHGDVTGEGDRAVVTFRAADGSAAECHVPFPPLPGPGPEGEAGGAAAGGPVAGWTARIAAHARAERTVGVFLVRLGGYAAGVFTGPGAAHLAASKVGSRLVHGRSAAGGQSQQRFARRREKQAGEALGAAADVAAAVFGPYRDQLDAVVLGGDRRAIAGLRDDPRLRPYVKLAVERFLTVPDPRLAVLRTAPRMFQAIRIRLAEGSRTAGRPER